MISVTCTAVLTQPGHTTDSSRIEANDSPTRGSGRWSIGAQWPDRLRKVRHLAPASTGCQPLRTEPGVGLSVGEETAGEERGVFGVLGAMGIVRG